MQFLSSHEMSLRDRISKQSSPELRVLSSENQVDMLCILFPQDVDGIHVVLWPVRSRKALQDQVPLLGVVIQVLGEPVSCSLAAFDHFTAMVITSCLVSDTETICCVFGLAFIPHLLDLVVVEVVHRKCDQTMHRLRQPD